MNDDARNYALLQAASTIVANVFTKDGIVRAKARELAIDQAELLLKEIEERWEKTK